MGIIAQVQLRFSRGRAIRLAGARSTVYWPARISGIGKTDPLGRERSFMKISTYALAVAIAGLAISTPAAAQYEGRQEQTTIRGQSGSASSKSEEEVKAQQEA